MTPRTRRRRSTWTALGPLLAGAGALLMPTGCGKKPKDFDNENDALRRRVIELESQVDRLNAENGEMRAKLAEASHAWDLALARGEPAAEILESLPRCSGIEFARYSGLGDRDGQPGPDSVDAYIRPFDGRRRFVQVAGRLSITVTLIPPALGQGMPAEARELTRAALGPRDLREAYRSGPLGTHYAVEMPLIPANQTLQGTVVIIATLIDAITGVSHQATLTVPVGPEP